MRAKEFIVENHTFADTGNAWENGKKDAMNFRPKNVEKYHLRHKYRSHYSDGYNVGLKRRDRSINPETGKPYIKFGPNGPITPEQGVAEGEMNFEEGDCPVFAIALHRLSKLPLMALVEYDEQMGSAVLIHAYVKLNNKWRIDATGEIDVDWMLQKYPNNGNAEEIEISEKDLIKLGYGKNKCPMLQQVLPHAKEVLQTIDNEQGVAEGTDPDKKYTIKKSYTMSKAGVEKAVWYIMDGDFVVDVTDLRRDAKYYADKWNAAEKESSNASQNLHKPDVAESFDQPYPMSWEKGDFGDVDALAKLDDGTNLHVMFNLADRSENDWGVEFYRGNSQSVTGQGDAQRVFATVLAAIGRFIKKQKPDRLFFTAVKEEDPTGSRAKLYDRLVQKYATGLGYELHKVDYPQQTGYKLTRKEQKISQAKR
jgi:hypothetical protein